MELIHALTSRRSVRRFTKKPIPKAILQEILNYAPWVPNHHVSEPWRFVVVTGESLGQLADLRADAVLTKRQGQPGAEDRAQKAREEFLEAAYVVAAIQKLDPNPVRREEDYAAMAMTVYNIMLAAWDKGVGSFWNTGPLIHDLAVGRWLNLAEDERTVAFIRLGYPETIPVTRRTPIAERIEWRE